MKKFILLLFCCSALISQPKFSDFIDRVNSAPDLNIKNSMVDSLMNAHQGRLPIIEGDYAIFLYRSAATKVQLAGDFNNWGSPLYDFSLLTGTNLYYYSKSFEPDARLDYKFVVNNNWILDPGNPKTCMGGFGPNSELAMSSYIQPWEIQYQPNIKHALLADDTIKSSIVNRTYRLKIFIPSEYFYSGASYPVIYFQDGEDYLNLAYAKNVLDNILDKGSVLPFIAVFVQPNNRNDEYAYNLRNLYARFFVEELVPYIDGEYRTLKDAKQRLVLGDSFGGNISALIAFNYPEIFGNCGQHSGAFWPNSYEVQSLFSNNPKKNIKLYSVWGTYESLFTSWRTLTSVLNAKSYEYKWKEYNEGHSWGLWRATLDEMIEYFFPKKTNQYTTPDQIPERTFLFSNYPNPFNPETIIKFSLSKADIVCLQIYDLMGREIAVLMNEYKYAGEHKMVFNADEFGLSSGVYFYSLRTGKNFERKKMLLLR